MLPRPASGSSRGARLTIEELERTLPNGFHDAEISTIRLDYVKRIEVYSKLDE